MEPVAGGEHLGDLGGVRGPGHDKGGATEAPCPVELVGGLEIRIAEAVIGSDGVADCR